MPKKKKFKLNISLTVLKHLGRNLYRSFDSVLCELISNSWDADAYNIWIKLDVKNSTMVVKDDGIGMTANEFQNQFLKVGYSKRDDLGPKSKESDRPFIGAKGIGKLALLSCAERISIATKKINSQVIGGVIDNTKLENTAIDDLNSVDFTLGEIDNDFEDDELNFKQGTLIKFSGLYITDRRKIDNLRKMIALSFRFSIFDKNFNIFINEEKISVKELEKLLKNTEFMWCINDFSDEFTDLFKGTKFSLNSNVKMNGFFATVEKPSNLRILKSGERIKTDLFVNGRLRERDILSHIPTSRIVENYLYGQIHFNEIEDSKTDPYTSSREGIIDENPEFEILLTEIRESILPKIFEEWDQQRLMRNKEGDIDNESVPQRERYGKLFITQSKNEFQESDLKTDKMVEEWLDSLDEDAYFNLTSYIDCFMTENICRKFIEHNKIRIPENIRDSVQKYIDSEHHSEQNLGFKIPQKSDVIQYFGIDKLVSCIVKYKSNQHSIEIEKSTSSYTPIRNALAHTRLLTEEAKQHLRKTYNRIKINLKKLLTEG